MSTDSRPTPRALRTRFARRSERLDKGGRCPHFRIQPQSADSASGGFVRQIPPLPVTPAVRPPKQSRWN